MVNETLPKNIRYMFCFSILQHLAATRTYANLDVPLCDILDSIHDHSTYQLATCKMTDQLFELMDKFVSREVNLRQQIQQLFITNAYPVLEETPIFHSVP